MNILVTGACGFIGSHLVEKLVKKNHNVRAFTYHNSRNSHGWLDNIDKKIFKDLKVIQQFLYGHSVMPYIMVLIHRCSMLY